MIKLKTSVARKADAEGAGVADKVERTSVDGGRPGSPSMAHLPSHAVTSTTPKKSPRRLAQSAQPAMQAVQESNSVQFEEQPPPPQVHVEVIGEDPQRRRRSVKSSTSSGGVKRKGRKKSVPQLGGVGLKLELATWRAKLADANNEELVAKIEQMVDQLGEKEPGLFRPSAVTLAAKQPSDSSEQQARVAALQRLCRRWLLRREALRQPEARAVRERLRVWDSFIASEKKYFLTLLTITQKCMRPLISAAPQHVTEETLVEIFGSLPEIKDQSKTLLSKLRTGTNGAQWISSTGLGALFLNEVLPVLKSYVLYVVEYPKRMQALARLIRKVPEVRAVIDKAFPNDGGGTAQSLPEMLLVPLQRMVAYEWTLQELLRLTPDDHCCREDLQKAVMGCAQLNLMLVMQKKQAARAQMLADAGDIHPQTLVAAVGSDGQSTFGSGDGRQFVRDGPVYVLGAAGEAEKRNLYLFSDCVAVGSLRPSGIVFDDCLLLRSCELTDSDESMMAKFVFEINGTGEGEQNIVDVFTFLTFLYSRRAVFDLYEKDAAAVVQHS